MTRIDAADAAGLFFRSWLKAPLKVAAYGPSSRALARRMFEEARIGADGPVIELGAGTGALTAALVEGGVDPKRLVLYESLPEFVAVLTERFPGARIVSGDAYAAPVELDIDDAAAIVSGLPLVQYPPRAAYVTECLDRLCRPGARFCQITYMPSSPVPLKQLPGIAHRVSATIWGNFPPARVWSYWRG